MSIEIKPQNRGKFHRALGVPQGKKIPNWMISKAKNSPSAEMRRMATFAENSKEWKR